MAKQLNAKTSGGTAASKGLIKTPDPPRSTLGRRQTALGERLMLTEEERLDFVAGQVNGLKAIMLAIVNTNPAPRSFVVHVDGAIQAALAKSESIAVSDVFLQGQADVTDAASAILAKHRAR
jgi:hypothetical protein